MKLQRWAGVSRIVIDHNAPCAKFAYVQAGKTGFFVPEHKHISHTPSVPGTAPPLRCKVCTFKLENQRFRARRYTHFTFLKRLAALLFQPGCCFLGGLVGGDVGVDGLLSEFLAGAGDILRHGDDE